MGLTINYRHRTKNLNKIKELINDLKAFAENTGRGFTSGMQKGYYRKPNKGQGEKKYPKDEIYNYYWSPLHSTPFAYEKRVPTKAIYFEMELKTPLGAEGHDWMGIQWIKVGDWWIANDWSKPPRPHGNTPKGVQQMEAQVAKRVIEEISILEYIKKYYFPGFKIDDEFDFHINYEDKKESQKQHWKDIKAGKYESYRRPDGTFPDYKARYLAKKNHDIKNIFASFGEINKTFAAIEVMMAKAGWTDKNVVRNMPINKPIGIGVSETNTPIGDQLVRELQDTIRGIKLSQIRKRQLTIREPRIPIKRVLIRRRDGHTQHYHKRLTDKRERK